MRSSSIPPHPCLLFRERGCPSLSTGKISSNRRKKKLLTIDKNRKTTCFAPKPQHIVDNRDLSTDLSTEIPEKKCLTNSPVFAIIDKSSSESGRRRSLKTIQREEVQRTVRFRRVKRLGKLPEAGSALASGFRRRAEGSRIRIEHQSLILAQDERWRRA